ncbi:putative transposase A [Pantoea stewartii subsp. stewartii DC283]|uniref:Putative transposase A n=1 Tax=Pantoea stewartii subsp. stewartii DC283 TaxID=660596 RepID=H3RKR3_PANSE|nr:putative transposase A [Pantoea stewartii subsp. stewartii DC283]
MQTKQNDYLLFNKAPEEFKIEAVKQVVDRGYSVSSIATRLNITTHSLYAWVKKVRS